jgi:hypothetical protein
MTYTIEDLRKQAKKYADEIDLDGLINSVDFSKVDTKKLKKIDFSRGLDNALHQLEQLPKVRITTEPPVEDHNEGGFVGGLLLGVVLGAIIALLFAPKTGHDTREMVAQTVGDLKEKVVGDDELDIEEVLEVAEDEVEEILSDEPAIERNFG